MLAFGFGLYGQDLKGKITNEKKEPLSGVNILNTRNGQHSHSNEHGFFTLQSVIPGDTLKFSHIGYKKMELVIQSVTESINIHLEIKSIELDEVVVGRDVNALNVITNIDIQTSPVQSSQEILRSVPGLFIGQHAGGGKAEQIFLRGFDIDHGTDINISVDGLPVNLVSHAHGQGYSDLHFVIPETTNKIDFGKGPYYADKGNFNTAGYVEFNTFDELNGSSIKMEMGQFNSYRLLGMFDVLSRDHHNGYIATEYQATDGPFDSPQNFNRFNIFGKYSGRVNHEDQIRATFSHFMSKWDASGQIPTRAVANGMIGRFGAIDDTEGGTTSRTSLTFHYDKFIGTKSSIKNKIFFSKYDFELYSNFTFFLEDPINGDQIRQKENRSLLGFSSDFNQTYNLGNANGEWQIGVGLRHDQSTDNELSHTANRTETIEQIQLGDIYETNASTYISTRLQLGKWAINPSLRLDYFDFQYADKLRPTYQTLSSTQAILSPKLNLFYNASDFFQLYFKTGKGFHSNDTRVILSRTAQESIPAAYGGDVGFLWKAKSKWLINLALWYLYLEQEFVYTGDAGIVEPSGKTKRLGVDFSARYQPIQWLFWNFDVNYAYARATEESSGTDYIPLAPDLTMTTSLRAIHPSGIFGSANLRYIKDRPANEDNSIVALGYTVVDLNIGYEWSKFTLSIQIQNLLNTEWNETQFATESRLQNEPQPVEEIHFTPGYPFFFKGIIEFKF